MAVLVFLLIAAFSLSLYGSWSIARDTGAEWLWLSAVYDAATMTALFAVVGTLALLVFRKRR